MTYSEREKLRKKQWKKDHPENTAFNAKKYRDRNREALAAKAKIYVETNKEYILAREREHSHTPEGKLRKAEYMRNWAKKNPERVRQAREQKTNDKWAKRIELHGTPENCAICCVVFDLNNRKSIHWDHCHTTGNFRGWLCNRCNCGIGLLKDCPEVLTKAVEYLRLYTLSSEI